MKDRSVAAAIVLLAVAVFVHSGMQGSRPLPPDQYVANDGEVYRFPGHVQGRIEVLHRTPQGGYEWRVAEKAPNQPLQLTIDARDATARLGVADICTFGLTWEDRRALLQRLGYAAEARAEA